MHSTSRRAPAAGALSAGYLGIAAPAALTQDQCPSRPVEFVVPWGHGSGADAVARKDSRMLKESLKTSFPVINAPGASARTGLNKMLLGQADDCTILVMTGDTFGLLADPQANWSRDQLVPAAVMIRQPSAFMVAENGRIKSWPDLEREAQARPIKVAVTGFGSPDDMTVNYFARRGMKLVSVPFAKPGERYSTILGGPANVLYVQPRGVRSFIDNKQMRPVILFGEKRHPVFANAWCRRSLVSPSRCARSGWSRSRRAPTGRRSSCCRTNSRRSRNRPTTRSTSTTSSPTQTAMFRRRMPVVHCEVRSRR